MDALDSGLAVQSISMRSPAQWKFAAKAARGSRGGQGEKLSPLDCGGLG